MCKKYEIIKEVFNEYNYGNYTTIMLFTKGFKATGEFIEKNSVSDLISIKNAKIYSYSTNCECDSTPEYRNVEWLNVFAKDIIAFSFIEFQV